jgi:phenylacetate-CoA ligase
MRLNNSIDVFHMLRNQWKPIAELEKLQNRRLTRLIQHVYRSVPYYKELFRSLGLRPCDIRTVHDLEKIPVMPSKAYRNIPLSDRISKEIDLDQCVSASTNGTTGSPLTVHFRTCDSTKLNLNWVRPLLANGVGLFHKRVVLARPNLIPNKAKWYQRIGLWRSRGISVFDDPQDWIALLKTYKPNIIHGYSTALKLMAESIDESEKPYIAPRIVFSVSETMDDDCRKKVSKTFNSRVIDLYGAAEAGCIAWECPICSRYHINADTVIVEFLERGTASGSELQNHVIVTNLYSFAMPIIRYEVNDVAIPISGQNACGRGLPSMKLLLGRSDDFVTLPSGKRVSPRLFSALMWDIDGLIQWRVEQERRDNLLISIVPSKAYSNRTIEQIRNTLAKQLKENIPIEIRLVEAIPRDPSGKLRTVISHLKEDLS